MRRVWGNVGVGWLEIEGGRVGGIYEKGIGVDRELFGCVNMRNDLMVCELNRMMMGRG